MNMQYFHELIELAEQLNFTKAAERLFVTQSALSKHVSAIERELGFRLFDRNTSQVELTNDGRLYIESIKEIVEQYEKTIQEIRRTQEEAGENIRVAGPLMSECMIQPLVEAHSLYAAFDPLIRITMCDIGVRDCEPLLFDGSADIAFSFRYPTSSRKLVYERLFEVPFGIACHASHPLATKKHLVFDDLAGQGIITYPLHGRASYHAFVAATCKTFGIGEQVEYLPEGSLCFPDLKGSVVFGVHFPGYSRFGDEIVSRPLEDDRVRFEACAVRRSSEEGSAVISFFDYLVERACLLRNGRSETQED